MKKVFLIITLMFSLLFATSCEKNEKVDNNSDDVSKENIDEVDESGFMEYVAGLNNIKDTEFKMYLSQTKTQSNTMFDTDIQGETGVIGWELENDNQTLIIVSYDSNSNLFVIDSYKSNGTKNIEKQSTIELSGITMADYITVDIMSVVLPNGKNAIIEEYTGAAYTFADGVDYRISIITVDANGKLTNEFEDGEMSSDFFESDLFDRVNEVTGYNYNCDMFYDGETISTFDGMKEIAIARFQSDAAELYSEGKEDEGTARAAELNTIYESQNTTIYWGKGQFVEYENKYDETNIEDDNMDESASNDNISTNRVYTPDENEVNSAISKIMKEYNITDYEVVSYVFDEEINSGYVQVKVLTDVHPYATYDYYYYYPCYISNGKWVINKQRDIERDEYIRRFYPDMFIGKTFGAKCQMDKGGWNYVNLTINDITDTEIYAYFESDSYKNEVVVDDDYSLRNELINNSYAMSIIIEYQLIGNEGMAAALMVPYQYKGHFVDAEGQTVNVIIYDDEFYIGNQYWNGTLTEGRITPEM